MVRMVEHGTIKERGFMNNLIQLESIVWYKIDTLFKKNNFIKNTKQKTLRTTECLILDNNK